MVLIMNHNLKLKIIFSNPITIYVQGWVFNFIEDLRVFLSLVENIQIVFLYSPSWTVGLYYDEIPLKVKYLTSNNHKWIVLCNDYYEINCMNHFGVNSILCPQSAFLDTNLYYIDNINEKKYDAVYSAQFQTFKRIELSEKINSVAILGYGNNDYYMQLRSNYNFHFLNGSENRMLQWDEVNNIYNSSRVGLCLSKEEGAMYASVEYLLCGLPIVTTLNMGGRDYFFDGRYVIYTEPKPDSVATAVYSLIDSNISQKFIRENTMKKIESVRYNFLNFIKSIKSTYGFDVSLEYCSDEFKENFSNKLIGDGDYLNKFC
jgi:glycosyltransferase involved in cell wall biosynthesis